jgi:hypothetical protein
MKIKYYSNLSELAVNTPLNVRSGESTEFVDFGDSSHLEVGLDGLGYRGGSTYTSLSVSDDLELGLGFLSI